MHATFACVFCTPHFNLFFPSLPFPYLTLNALQRYDAVEAALEADPPGTPAAVLTVSNAPKFFSNGIDPVWYVAEMSEDSIERLLL